MADGSEIWTHPTFLTKTLAITHLFIEPQLELQVQGIYKGGLVTAEHKSSLTKKNIFTHKQGR